jgi:hypothetical protein
MPLPEWKDTTCYNKTSHPRTSDARTWVLDLEDNPRALRLVVTRMFPLDDKWFFRCKQLDIDTQLESEDAEDAKREALVVAFKLTERMFKTLVLALEKK